MVSGGLQLKDPRLSQIDCGHFDFPAVLAGRLLSLKNPSINGRRPEGRNFKQLQTSNLELLTFDYFCE
jgi:hypothetical protein